jgi:hypothetical protein
MKNLREEDILRIMREEWSAKIKALSEEVDIAFNTKVDGKEKEVISPDLKVKHKETGVIYTIRSVGPIDVVLVSPDGEKMLRVDSKTLEDDYVL